MKELSKESLVVRRPQTEEVDSPLLRREAGSMTMLAIEGLNRLSTERLREIGALERYVEEASDIFEAHTDGMHESALVQKLVEMGATQSVASACADELLSGGIAQKDWTTGYLSHLH